MLFALVWWYVRALGSPSCPLGHGTFFFSAGREGCHWELQNGLVASSVSAWHHGMALLATGVGLGARFSGLCVVCGSCLVASSGFMEAEAAHLPRNAGAPPYVDKKRAIAPHRHHPRAKSAAPTPRSAGRTTPIGLFLRWCSGCMQFPGDCTSQARNGRGMKEAASKPQERESFLIKLSCFAC
jgi:hypothetical protein